MRGNRSCKEFDVSRGKKNSGGGLAYDRSKSNEKYPIPGNRNLQFIKNTITKPNITAGEYSYYNALNGKPFEDQVFYIWFTGQKGNHIGRINAGGER